MIFNQSKNKHVIFSEVLHCLRITFHRRRGGRMEGTLSPSLLMCWSPSTYLSILAFKTVKLRGRTLFCLQSSYLNIQRLWRQLITPQRKSSVTPHKSIHPLSWSPQQLMPTHGYSDLYGFQIPSLQTHFCNMILPFSAPHCQGFCSSTSR